MPSPQKSEHHTDHSRVHNSSRSRHERPQAAAKQSAEGDANKISKLETSSRNETCKRVRQESESLKPDASSHPASKPRIKDLHTSSDSKDRRKESRSECKTLERDSDSCQADHVGSKHTGSSADGQKVYCMHSSAHAKKHEDSRRHTHASSRTGILTAAASWVHSGSIEQVKKDVKSVDSETNDSSNGACEPSSASTVAKLSLADSEKILVESAQHVFQPAATNVVSFSDINVQQDEHKTKPDEGHHRCQVNELASRCLLAERDNACEKVSNVNTLSSNELPAPSVAIELSACTTASVISTTAEDNHPFVHHSASESIINRQSDLLPKQTKNLNSSEAGRSAEEVERSELNHSCGSDVTSRQSIVTESLSSVYDENAEHSSVTRSDLLLATEASTDVFANPCIGTVEDSCQKPVAEVPFNPDRTDVLSDVCEISTSLHPLDADIATDSHSAAAECIPSMSLATGGYSEEEKEEDVTVKGVQQSDDSGCR